MPKLLAALKRKVGPFPLGVWAAIVVGGVGVAIVVRRRTAALAGGAPATPEPAGGATDTLGIPFSSDTPTLPFSVGPPVFSPPFGQMQIIDDTGLAPGGGIGEPQRVTVEIVQRLTPAPAPRPKARRRRKPRPGPSPRAVRRQVTVSPAERLARQLRRRDPRLTKQQARRRARRRLAVR